MEQDPRVQVREGQVPEGQVPDGQVPEGQAIHQASQPKERKVWDAIHDFIDFDEDIWKVIDTEEFQRLRYLKQLGGVCYVFPTAHHTRFEHSLGAAYLAQKLVKRLFKNDPLLEKNLDGWSKFKIQRNVTLAGLLHDIGHGPFSHLFEEVTKEINVKFDHEEAADNIINLLFNNLEKNQVKLSDFDENDKRMIKDLIRGKPKEDDYKNIQWIFQIVSNKKTEIDVDKFDYFARDSYNIGLRGTTFDYRALIREARVIGQDICFPSKLAYHVCELFRIRYRLYRDIYHNRAVDSVQAMLQEVMKLADAAVQKADDKFEALVENTERYIGLNDSILNKIQYSTSSPECLGLIKRIHQHNLWRYVDESIVAIVEEKKSKAGDETPTKLKPNERTEKFEEQDVRNELEKLINEGKGDFESKENLKKALVVKVHGLSYKLMIEAVRFYNKGDYSKSEVMNEPDKLSFMLPEKMNIQYIRTFTKDDSLQEKIKGIFQKWCRENRLQLASTTSPSRKPSTLTSF